MSGVRLTNMISPDPNDSPIVLPQFTSSQLDALNGWRSKDWAINIYSCFNDHSTTTVDVDSGVTPASILCPKCKSPAMSALYPRVRPVPSHIPEITHEWFRMNSNKAETLSIAEQYHHNNGGLFLRKRTRKVPIKNPYA